MMTELRDSLKLKTIHLHVSVLEWGVNSDSNDCILNSINYF